MRRSWHNGQTEFAFIGLLLGFSLLITLPALVVDERVLDGANVWIKTIKFQTALSVYFLTLVFFSRWIPPAVQATRKFRVYAMVVCLMTAAEILWIGGASAFAVKSHYNETGILMMLMYPLMGIFAVTLTTASFVMGWLVMRHGDSKSDPALRLSIGVGLMLTCVLTLVCAGTMSSLPSPLIGVHSTGSTVPIIGWASDAGDLRVSHFFATHTMHFVPAVGALTLLMKRATWRKRIVAGTAIAYTAFVLTLFVQALSGIPFLADNSFAA